jgi:hypothetical protein
MIPGEAVLVFLSSQAELDALVATHIAQIEALQRDLKATHEVRTAESHSLHSDTVTGLQQQVAASINNHLVWYWCSAPIPCFRWFIENLVFFLLLSCFVYAVQDR